MSAKKGSAKDLVDRLARTAPELLDLTTARTDEEFEEAFDAILEKALMGLEESRNNFASLDEEGLTSALTLALNMPGLTVSREKDSNGHVDLTIDANHCCPARKKLAEAKIYRGWKYHLGGLQQLLGRYTTGREGRGLLIVYCRKPGVAQLIDQLREQMDRSLPLQQIAPTTTHTLKWSFISVHHHACGEDLAVGHIACNLHTGSQH